MKTFKLLRISLPAMVLASIALTVLPACSSTEEEEPPADTSGCRQGDDGRCCDVDPMQSGCGS